MSNEQFNEVTADLPVSVRDALRERACIMAEGNHWTDEEANRRVWNDYLEVQAQTQARLL